MRVSVKRFDVSTRAVVGTWIPVCVVGHVDKEVLYPFRPFVGLKYVDGPAEFIEFRTPASVGRLGKGRMVVYDKGAPYECTDIHTPIYALRFPRPGSYVIEAVAGIGEKVSGAWQVQDRRSVVIEVSTPFQLPRWLPIVATAAACFVAGCLALRTR